MPLSPPPPPPPSAVAAGGVATAGRVVEPSAPPFLDVETLLASSLPRPRPLWSRYPLLVVIGIMIGTTLLGGKSGQSAAATQAVGTLLILGFVSVMALTMLSNVRAQRREQRTLQTIEEFIQLRRWADAGLVAQEYLSRPARTPWARAQTLIFLVGILMRYHRFADAIALQEYLLDAVPLDGATRQSIQLGRAMAMLREDRLVDADRAITDLRRAAHRAPREEIEPPRDTAGAAAGSDPPDANTDADTDTDPFQLTTLRAPRTHASAGLALVELYRDVKTGHPNEAIATFRDKLPILRAQLAHRVADAYALAARAFDLLNQPTEATLAYEQATLLAPAAELARRYPEIKPLSARYAPARAPQVDPASGSPIGGGSVAALTARPA